jgi:adenosylcobinamide-GDP ribazoletransferase
MFRQQINRFFNAVTFYSRLPGPNWVDYSGEQLNRASGYFPFIGYLVALWCYGTYLLFSQFLPHDVSMLISMVSGILFTGAFHEDGFADLCDGFGGGFTQADILRIMKDSRLGTYGVCGLLFMLLMKWQSLSALPIAWLCISLFVAHSLSRAWAISLIMVLPYVQEDAHSKAKPIAKQWFKQDMLLAWAVALAPLYWLPLSMVAGLLCMGFATFVVTRQWYKQRLAGYTGDALGASQQVHEIFIYLFLLASLS